MKYEFKQKDMVGIITFIGELTSKTEDRLKLVLLKAVHGIDRAVLNFGGVSTIDSSCLELLRRAYCASIRFGRPLILTDVPALYDSEIRFCGNYKNLCYSC